MWKVFWNKKVDNQLKKLPVFIQEKFRSWTVAVELEGLPSIRKIPGFHDEPLKGNRKGQRSIKLNRSYRAIYIQDKDGEIFVVEVIEVNKHEY